MDKKNTLAKIVRNSEHSIRIKKTFFREEANKLLIYNLAKSCINVLSNGGKIILAGNGGSFSDAQHISAEFVARFLVDRRALASIVLGMNNSTLTAIGNDFGFDYVFTRELEALANPEDIFIPISTSGNSSNIINATKQAIRMNIEVVALTGGNGGELSQLCDCITVKECNTARIQECHILIGHIVSEIVESELISKHNLLLQQSINQEHDAFL